MGYGYNIMTPPDWFISTLWFTAAAIVVLLGLAAAAWIFRWVGKLWSQPLRHICTDFETIGCVTTDDGKSVLEQRCTECGKTRKVSV